ncbi:nucleotide modification associated domain-containing protein [Geoglobus acetivorans]|uniref:Nucleotide modification associated domain-containing protein n=1 Tax=Geoglobus acetivorans TaxID=565033 RepID=A0A0A7GD10_GEOAI|nr:hypothetical protein GACE_0872 [Geoglobus acetivorans]
MTKLISELGQIFTECLEIARKKNRDYAGNRSPFHNFELCERLGICSLEEGILVRMTDKMSRIANLLKKEADVRDESIEDTLKDLINYSAILIAYLRTTRENND